jgi:hypothetical protein
MERYELFLPSPRPVCCCPGPFVKQGIGAILRLEIRCIGRCTLKRPVGNYRYNRTASLFSTRLVGNLQLTCVAAWHNRTPFRREFLQWHGRNLGECDAHVEKAHLLRFLAGTITTVAPTLPLPLARNKRRYSLPYGLANNDVHENQNDTHKLPATKPI